MKLLLSLKRFSWTIDSNVVSSRPQPSVIAVSGLPVNTKANDLHNIFSKYGFVGVINLIPSTVFDMASGKLFSSNLLSALVSFEDKTVDGKPVALAGAHSARVAVKSENGGYIGGTVVSVSLYSGDANIIPEIEGAPSALPVSIESADLGVLRPVQLKQAPANTASIASQVQSTDAAIPLVPTYKSPIPPALTLNAGTVMQGPYPSTPRSSSAISSPERPLNLSSRMLSRLQPTTSKITESKSRPLKNVADPLSAVATVEAAVGLEVVRVVGNAGRLPASATVLEIETKSEAWTEDQTPMLLKEVAGMVGKNLDEILVNDINRRVLLPLVNEVVDGILKEHSLRKAAISMATSAEISFAARNMPESVSSASLGSRVTRADDEELKRRDAANGSLPSFKKKPTVQERSTVPLKRPVVESDSSSDDDAGLTSNRKEILVRQKNLSIQLKDAQKTNRSRLAAINWSSDESSEEEEEDSNSHSNSVNELVPGIPAIPPSIMPTANSSAETKDVETETATPSFSGDASTVPEDEPEAPENGKSLYESLLEAQRNYRVLKKKPRFSQNKRADSDSTVEKGKKVDVAARKKKRRNVSQHLAAVTGYVRPTRQQTQFPPSPTDSAQDVLLPFVWPAEPIRTFNYLNIDPDWNDLGENSDEYDSDASLDFSNLDLVTGIAGDDRREEDLKFLHAAAVEERLRRKRSRLMKLKQRGEEIDVEAEMEAYQKTDMVEEFFITFGRHRTGAARTEGYYKIPEHEKYKYLNNNNRSLNDDPLLTTPAGSNSAYSASSGGNNSTTANSAQRSRGLSRNFGSGGSGSNGSGALADPQVRSASNSVFTAIYGENASDVIKYNDMRSRKNRLRFARSKIHDWGLFALEPIQADEIVIEYIGEMIRQKVADHREKLYEKSGIGSSYLFRIDDDNIIDATKSGNLARFINHCCDPNCNAKIITVDGQKKIVIYANKSVAEGEEITYDYKFPIEEDKIPCLCGAQVHAVCLLPISFLSWN
ncbi:hypothetical protein HDU83_009656 [Entophlyctis luteolus]|nr:hypothetical protein HDU83_009656 [Entophlyctis luteolus]